jgi:hypothetical protein
MSVETRPASGADISRTSHGTSRIEAHPTPRVVPVVASIVALPRTVCPPSPFDPSPPHGPQPHVLLRALENHSKSLPSAPSRKNRGRLYRSSFSVPSVCNYAHPGGPATLVAASDHVAPTGRCRAPDFSPPVRSPDIKMPPRISVNEPCP